MPDRRSSGVVRLFVLVLAGTGMVGLHAPTAMAQHSLQPPFQPSNQESLQNYSAEFPPNGPPYSLMRSQVMAAETARRLRDRPDSLDAFEMLVYTEKVDDQIAMLRRLIQASPAQMSGAFELLLQRPQALRQAVAEGRMPDPVPTLIGTARQQLPRLSRADAARVERTLILFEHPGFGADQRRAAAIGEFMARYADTAAAQEAEVDLIEATTTNRASWIPPLDDIVRRHPGTTAAARALYEKGFQLSSNLRPPNNSDPTDQFLAVLDIVKELESGRYPANLWSARAAWLGIELYWRNVEVLSATNADRLLTGYIDFIKSHFTLPEGGEMAGAVRSLLNTQVFALFALKNDGIGGVERTLAELERVDPPRARYWRGAFYVERLTSAAESERSALLDKARASLSSVSASGSGVYGRVALAMLASLEYNQGRYDAARAAFSSYVAANPATPFSSLAALRIGQCDEMLGDLDGAVRTFEDVATRFASVEMVRQLGLVYAGRANERRGQFVSAIADYERALAGWGDRRRTLRLDTIRASTSEASTFRDTTGIELERRLTELKTSALSARSDALERGRALLNDGHRREAAELFDRLVREEPASPLRDEARRLSHRTRLQEAVDLASLSNASRNDAAALRILAGMERDADDVARVAQIVRATLLARQRDMQEADGLLATTLAAWQDAQSTTGGPSTLPSDVVADVSAIRTQIFEGESPSADWRNHFEWRPIGSQFDVINSDVTVARAGDVPKLETVYPSRVTRNVLFMNTEDMFLLVESLNGLSARRGNGPSAAREPFAPDVMAFLTAYLPAESCMIGGLCTFATVPNVLSVVFEDEARTRAAVDIRTWSSGGTVRVEKQDGQWRVTGVVSAYVN